MEIISPGLYSEFEVACIMRVSRVCGCFEHTSRLLEAFLVRRPFRPHPLGSQDASLGVIRHHVSVRINPTVKYVPLTNEIQVQNTGRTPKNTPNPVEITRSNNMHIPYTGYLVDNIGCFLALVAKHPKKLCIAFTPTFAIMYGFSV